MTGALALLTPSPAAADLVGVVRDASSGRAIGGAIVRVQASGAPVFTDAEGRYELPVNASGARVAAGAKGYFSMGLDAHPGAPVDFALEPVPHDPARPVELADPAACVGCHAAQVADWRTSAMAHAGRNTWVEDLYMGTGTRGGAGGFVYTRDSVHAGKNPASECASCHQPESWVAAPFSPLRAIGDPHPSVERGVSCLTCHLVAHVDEARPNDPGIYPGTVQMNRGSIVRYGVLGDVDFDAEGRMRASYQPQLPSAVCGACHQDANDPGGSGKFDGPRRRARDRAGVARSWWSGSRPAARAARGTVKKALAMGLLLLTTAEKESHAQGPADPRAELSADKELDTVVVTGTRTPERSQRATVKTDVVTREEAERRGATNVAEALSTQPGVRVDPGAYGHLGGVSAIQIQGFDLQRVLILEDGEPVVGDVGGAVDLAGIPLGDVERIEIVTGPTSALYGSSAIGGVVNVITAPPRREGPSARLRAEGRSHESLLLQGSGAYRKGGAWIGLEANAFRQDGIARTPGLPDLHVPKASRFMLGARGGATLSRRVDVRVRARWFRDRLDGLSSKLAPGLGRYLIEEPNDTDRYTLHVVERLDLGGGSSLRLTLGRQWVDNMTAQRQQGSPVGERHDRYNRMHSAEAIGTIADGARTWVVGGRAEVETFTQTVTTTESLSSGLTTRTEEEVAPQTLGRAAIYGQLEWKLGESLRLLPGVRAEMHTPRYGGALTPRLAMSYRPVSELQVRASAGRGFRAPTAKELGFVFDHSSLGYRVIGNSDLVTESSWGVNGDVTWRPARAYTLRAGGFMNWVDDLIDLDLEGGVANGAVVDYRYVNFGKARTFGAEVTGSARLGDRLRADVSYDYLWTRDDMNDRPLGGRPPHTVTAALRATLGWKLEADARWRVSTPAFVSAETRSPGYQTIDLRLARELWARSRAYLGVLNVTDVHQLPGRVGDLRPPLGRVFYVGIRAELPWEEEE